MNSGSTCSGTGARDGARARDPERAGAVSWPTPSGSAITLELVQLGIRIAVEADADRTTLAMVLNVLGAGATR